MNGCLPVVKHCIDLFNEMPERARLLFFSWMMDKRAKRKSFSVIMGTAICESPIEIIFYIAFLYVCDINNANDIADALEVQVDTMTKEGYRADFMFCSDLIYSDTRYESFELVIECDGYDFHSSKTQIKHDNERNLALKMSGYDILHFSGTQIYNEPMDCAESAFRYISAKLTPIKKGDDSS